MKKRYRTVNDVLYVTLERRLNHALDTVGLTVFNEVYSAIINVVNHRSKGMMAMDYILNCAVAEGVYNTVYSAQELKTVKSLLK